ncbi:hypothetical protein D3C83_160360 [compost metagenome]
MWKNVSIGIDFSCKPGEPGFRINVPPRHFSAGAAAVMPVSSRITRRRSNSRSFDESNPWGTMMGGALLSRSLTMGNGSPVG